MTGPFSVYGNGVMTPARRVMAAKTVPTDEISSQESTMYAGWDLGAFQNPDKLVGKKGLKVYQAMMNDEQVKACMMVKLYSRLSTGWQIVPGDDKDQLSKQLAEFAEAQTKRMKGTFYDALLEILTAVYYGYSITEIVLEYIENGPWRGKVGLKALKTREPFGYGFKTDEHSNLLGIVYENLRKDNDEKGSWNNPFPAERFVVYAYNKKFGNWFGDSDLKPAYRSFFAKNAIMAFYNIFLERFGSPLVWATYPSGTDKGILTMVDGIIKNLQSKSGFRVPEGIKMQLLEAARAGHAGYDKAIEMHNTMIARAILIPELLGFSGRLAGSQALGEVQFKVFLFVLEKLARDIEETIVEEQIFKPLIDIDFDVKDPRQYPKFKMNTLEEENIESRAKVLDILAKHGFIDPREEWVRDHLKLPKDERDELPEETKPKPTPKPEPKPEPGDGGGGKKPEEPDPEDKPKMNTDELETYALRREPTKFEQKVGFTKFAKSLAATDDLLRQRLIPIFTKQRDKLLRDVERNDVINQKDLAFVKKLQISYVGDVKKAIQQSMVKAHLDNKLQVLEEIQRGGVEITIVNRFAADGPVPFQPWTPVAPAQAVEIFDRKILATIVTTDGVKKVITMGKMKELTYYDAQAFAISGIERDYVLKEAQMILQTGIKQGLANKEIMSQLHDIFNKYIPTGEIIDGNLVRPARLESIVRTNISDAINQGRRAMMTDPLVKSFVPFLMVSAIIDDRTTAYCEWLDGKQFKADDPSVQLAPHHFSCRTIEVPITTIEVEKVGGIETSVWDNNPVTRAKGFKEN